jgi:hypothetical protein
MTTQGAGTERQNGSTNGELGALRTSGTIATSPGHPRGRGPLHVAPSLRYVITRGPLNGFPRNLILTSSITKIS